MANDEFGQDIYTLANNSTILSFKDITNDTWDNSKYNNIRVLITRFGEDNRAYMTIPAFVDSEEIRAVCKSILTGNFSKIKFSGGYGNYVSYGGSKRGGLAKEKGKRVIENDMESRVFSLSMGKDGSFYVKIEIYKGESKKNGAIKPVGDTLLSGYFKLNQQQILVTASSIVSYLDAKQVISISNYIESREDENN